MEQLVILVLIGLISFINWIVQKSAEARKKRAAERQAMEGSGESLRQAPPPAKPAPEVNSDEAIRRLREALGLPEEAPTPVPPARRPVITPPPLPPQPAPVAKKPKPSVRPPAAVVVDEEGPDAPVLHSWKKKTVEPPRRPQSRLRELLGSPGGLQDAVVLSEILGRPKGAR